MNSAKDLSQCYALIKNKIGELSQGKTICLIAVSKKQPLESLLHLYDLGQRDFGENYQQELLTKAQAFTQRGIQDVRWHFIGHLQTNKIKALLPVVHCIHTLDHERQAQEIEKRLAPTATAIRIFVEVNLNQEASKAGIPSENTATFIQKLSTYKTLQLEGLMAIPHPDHTREAFSSLNQLSRECGHYTRQQLSMGMSSDYEMAIQMGATHLRLGTAIFGERPPSRV